MEIKFEFVERIKKDKNFGAEGHCTKLPERATKFSAGYDFYYLDSEPTVIQPNEIVYVKTGVKSKFPENMVLKLYNRSSNPKKKGLILANRSSGLWIKIFTITKITKVKLRLHF